jgi:crotonobetainyl-CoA:carnitine CoA-transferase CaiB-like acyl-CoA transferase
LPLCGIKVVALEHAVAGPICTRHLADLGADVVKVERLASGDFARAYDSYVHGSSSYFVWLNRGKKSVALDLKSGLAQPVLRRLVDTSDVLVQNLAPGAASRLGLGYEEVRVHNPRCVVVDISGYGDSGPFAQRKAYDMLIQAEAGLMSITGTGDTPSRVGISIADLATGLYAQTAVLAALLRRSRTGVGANVKVAMLDALAEWMTHPMYRHAYHGSAVPRLPSSHPAIAPYGIHATRNGQVIFGVQNEREWAVFCRIVMGKAVLTSDPRFQSNNARRENVQALTALIEARFATLDSLEVVALLEKAGIASGRLNDPAALWEHEQLAARDRWRTIGVPGGQNARALLPPVTFSDHEAPMGDVPALGEHTTEVIGGLGFTPEQIAELQSAGAVAPAPTLPVTTPNKETVL